MLRSRLKKGLPTPAIDRMPVLNPFERHVWDFFQVLHTARPVGMGPSGIPIREIVVLLDEWGLDDSDIRDDYFRLVQALDRKYLEISSERMKADANPSDGNRQPGGRGRRTDVHRGR